MVVAVIVMVTVAQMIGLFDGSLLTRVRQGAAAPAPPPATMEAGGTREIHIAAHESGHYLIDATVNGIDMPFLVDTGASWVTLSKAEAERAGIDTEWLDYDLRMQTANGVIRAARIELEEVRIGEMELRDVTATVNDSPMGISLLGMNFLERLDGYEVRDETLILRW